MALLGRLAIEPQRLRLIYSHAATGGQQVGVVVLAPIQPGRCRQAIFAGGRDFVDGATPAMFPATPDHIAGHQMPALRRNLEPAQRQRLITCNAAPFQQDLPKQGLGVDHALLRRHQDGLGGTHRRVIEHALQLLDGEDFFTAQ